VSGSERTDAAAVASLPARLLAEGLGTALLLAAVVGSGLMAERLAAGNAALALLCYTLATGAALLALIVSFGPVSGAQFNPVVTLALAARRRVAWREVPGHLLVQCGGAVLGVFVAHAMFGRPLVSLSTHERAGGSLVFSEGVATTGLVLIVLLGVRRPGAMLPFAVAAWIVGAYWFTSSTCFANPAVTLARSLTDSFTGIRPLDVPGFLAGQLAGAALAVALDRALAANSEAGTRRPEVL
jgi:glycerol uptake facilitator-like aquaporin